MNPYIIGYILFTLLTIACVVLAFYSITGGVREGPYLKLAFLFVFLSAPCVVIGGTQISHERDQETFSAWVKHTENPNQLTFAEWKALNRNYVPRGKHERRNRQPELD